EVGKALVEALQNAGGVVTAKDLTSYQPTERQPLRGTYLGKQVLTMPPPSSGGVALLEVLNTLSAWEAMHPDKSDPLMHNQPKYLQVLTEAMKHAYADRAEYLGDTDFVKVPIAQLISPHYAATLAKKIHLNETQPLKSYGRTQPVKDAGTSHFSVMDAAGNAVACTETINTYFGSLFVEPKFGIVLNNEMDDFAAILGEPNAFGLIQSEANMVEPGKKPLSSMTPTIVLQDGKALIALGGSGGPRIISSTLQVLLNIMRFDMAPQPAVAEPRIHHQWLPNIVYIEPPLYEKMKGSLQERGHNVGKRTILAVVQAILRTPKGLEAASDPRKHGSPAGY
ncbi:MAG: gamma-glutamyltransferase, partial [Planctomycetaceae bacterium]|nr:gamma-glutamyltransferase [Planctomycetaceae bacterium]